MDNLPAICAELRLRAVGGVPYASSLDIAERFQKQHKDVLRVIDRLATETSEDFARRNFALSEYTDSTGRKLRCFDLTRAGFSMVAFGFTGVDVVAWQEKYILAFDAMETALRSAIPTLDQIERMFDAKIAPVLDDHGQRLARIERVIDRVDGNVTHVRLAQPEPPRQDPSAETREMHRRLVASEVYRGKCPCGCGVKILDENNQPLPNCQWDHNYKKHQNGPKEGWLVTRDDNNAMEDPHYRKSKDPRFTVWCEEFDKMFPSGKIPKEPKVNRGTKGTISQHGQWSLF